MARYLLPYSTLISKSNTGFALLYENPEATASDISSFLILPSFWILDKPCLHGNSLLFRSLLCLLVKDASSIFFAVTGEVTWPLAVTPSVHAAGSLSFCWHLRRGHHGSCREMLQKP